jgi:mannose-6-phosphate isomerase-like protein (cupin superfamily)/DNA-binding XRE family transcriptional regulator
LSENVAKKLGALIKDMRGEKGWSLKELGAKTDLSAGYLSMIERGLTSVTITSLQSIADALSMDISEFFGASPERTGGVTRSYEREVCYRDGTGYTCLSLAGDMGDDKSVLEPIIAVIPPETDRKRVEAIGHEGEEFMMVLDGIATVILGGSEFEMYQGDSLHILSQIPHYVGNFSNRVTQVLYVNTPKILKKARRQRTRNVASA